MELDDPRWGQLEGDRRVRYDPRPALTKLAEGRAAEAWTELWQELFHQGDVGAASYAAVPALMRTVAAEELADWNLYALCASIEEGRQHDHNPPLPDWLRAPYDDAWAALVERALHDYRRADAPELVRSILAVLAHGKGQHALASLADFTDAELWELIDGPADSG